MRGYHNVFINLSFDTTRNNNDFKIKTISVRNSQINREINQRVLDAHLGHHGMVFLQRFLVFFKLGLLKLDFVFCTFWFSFLAFFLFFFDDRALKRKQNKTKTNQHN